MQLYTDLATDPIQELRYRRWARENYASAAGRDPNWHPLILDEMQRRDAEESEGSSARGVYSYVPLAPTPAWLIDPPHAQPPRPNLLLSVAEVDRASAPLFL